MVGINVMVDAHRKIPRLCFVAGILQELCNQLHMIQSLHRGGGEVSIQCHWYILIIGDLQTLLLYCSSLTVLFTPSIND
jgi:hypothetical protein